MDPITPFFREHGSGTGVICRAAAEGAEVVERGHAMAGAKRFDFWTGEGAWATMPSAPERVAAQIAQFLRGAVVA